MLVAALPPNALKEKGESVEPHPKVISVINPSLSLDDRTALIETLRFLDANDRFVTLNAINSVINQYVEKRTVEIYRAMGGEANYFENVLVAAGDGSATSGLLEEREKDEKGRWNKGLPKAIGLFPYQLKMSTPVPKKEQEIESALFTTNDFETIGDNRITNVHFDVWGYNSKKQTTVVVERNGLNYHLFGAGDTRFLSPDSSFSEGTTFYSIIADLEFNKIAKLNEMIYGKRGFDYWIAYNTKKKDETELQIEKGEHSYSDMTQSTITTSSKAPKEVRKAKKKARKTPYGGGPVDYQPTTDSNKKDRRKKQQTIVDLYNLFDEYGRKIKELEKQKQEAIDLMAKYQQRLDLFKSMMGELY